ncbi:MAG: cysteine-rich KTR domain-containing protein [Ruminococcus sp.]|nr:cysteine-rich KTR domain-containing protein [Ruminococcus sp.]
MANDKKENITIRNDTLYHECGAILLKLKPDTVLVNCPTYCRKCKKEILVTVINEKLVG